MNLNELPDFDDLVRMIEVIKDLAYQKSLLEVSIKNQQEKIMIEATNNEEYFEKGKPRAITYITNAWTYSGFNDELIPMRNELARISSELEYNKSLFDLEKSRIDIWRTLSANERAAVL